MMPHRPQAAPPGRPREHGFTLIELLVSLTLMALIAVVLSGGLRFGASVWRAGDAHADRLSEMQAIQGFARRQLSRAEPLRRSASRSRREIEFSGRSDAVRFIAILPAHLGTPGFHQIEFREARAGGSMRLMLEMRLYQSGEEGESLTGEARERILLDGIESAEFSYFGSTERNVPPSWRSQWDGADRLPSLVRLRVRFPEGDRRVWPELVVPTRIETPTGFR
jgi:general secretion pathway protein J